MPRSSLDKITYINEQGIVNSSYVNKVFFLFHFPDPVCHCHYPHRPDLLHGGLQVPVSSLSVHYHELWVHLFAAISPFLVSCLHQGSEAAKDYKKWKQ